jgi:hypothetical protein
VANIARRSMYVTSRRHQAPSLTAKTPHRCINRNFRRSSDPCRREYKVTWFHSSVPSHRLTWTTPVSDFFSPQMLGLDRILNLSLAAQTFLFGAQDQQAITSSGCGSPSPWKFDSTHHSNRTIGDRSFYVHIPASYDQNVPHAVVLSFHGFKGDDVQQEKISGFSAHGLKINGQVRFMLFFFSFADANYNCHQRVSLQCIRWVHMAQGRTAIHLSAHGRVHRMLK